MSGYNIPELFSGVKWQGNTITYSFPDSVPVYYNSNSSPEFITFTDPYKELADSLFVDWEK